MPHRSELTKNLEFLLILLLFLSYLIFWFGRLAYCLAESRQQPWLLHNFQFTYGVFRQFVDITFDSLVDSTDQTTMHGFTLRCTVFDCPDNFSVVPYLACARAISLYLLSVWYQIQTTNSSRSRVDHCRWSAVSDSICRCRDYMDVDTVQCLTCKSLGHSRGIYAILWILFFAVATLPLSLFFACYRCCCCCCCRWWWWCCSCRWVYLLLYLRFRLPESFVNNPNKLCLPFKTQRTNDIDTGQSVILDGFKFRMRDDAVSIMSSLSGRSFRCQQTFDNDIQIDQFFLCVIDWSNS